MLSKLNKVSINSIIIVITVSLSGIILHELSHFLVAKELGVKAIYHSDHVILTKNPHDWDKMIVAFSGPLFSLIFGVVMLAISYQSKKGSILRLLLIWCGLYNIASFLGYTLISSFVNTGDTGIVLQYFNIPIWVRLVISLLSYLILRYIFPTFTNQFIIYSNPNQNGRSSKELFTYPLLISILFIFIISQPVATWISILPIIFVPFSFIGIIKKYNKIIRTKMPTELFTIDRNYPILILLCITTAIIFVIFK